MTLRDCAMQVGGNQLFAKPQAPAFAIFGAALLAAACFAFGHRDGVWVTPDGWAYWEGAVSLLQGRGYSYFSGNPIVAWPPLYSVYLAAWTGLFGPSALSVNIATGALVAAQAAAWMTLALKLAPADARRRPVALALAALFIVAFLALNQRELLAHSLLYLFLPVQIMRAQAIIASDAPRLRDVVWLGVASTLAALSHNIGLAFTLAICVTILALSKQRRAKAMPLMLAALAAAMLWAMSRIAFGQSASHAIGLGQAAQSPLIYLVQGVAGCAELRALGPAGYVIFAAMLGLAILYRRDPGVRLAGMVAALLFLVSLVMFSVVYVKDELSGRFLQFVPLLLAPVLMLRAAADVGPRLALLAALALPNLVYAAAVAAVAPPPADRVPNAAIISRDAPPGKMVRRHNVLLVGPVDWEEPPAVRNVQAAR
jgi:hypothetical protein